MTNYDYREAMAEDIREYLAGTDERDQETLYDELWICDSVTGNASGSYTFNSYTAKEYLNGNEDILTDALQEFCTPSETIAEKFLSCDWEYFDVTIRCYLLGEVLADVLEELEEEEEEEL